MSTEHERTDDDTDFDQEEGGGSGLQGHDEPQDESD